MEAFLAVAGVVGFVASIDSIINLCKRLLAFRALDDQTVRARVLAIDAVYKRLKQAEAQFEEQEKTALIACNASVHKDLSRAVSKLANHKLMIFKPKSISTDLDSTDRVLNVVSIMVQLKEAGVGQDQNTSSSSEDHRASDIHSENMLLRRILDPENKKLVTQQFLTHRGIYERVPSHSIPEATRFVTLGGVMYVVDAIARGTSPKETSRRISRLGRLILLLRDVDDVSLTKIVKIVEQDQKLYVLSEVQTFTTLEEKLCSIRNKKKVLLNLAGAIESLHDNMIVHEGISSNNILIDDNEDIKLTGFLFARTLLELSDRDRASIDPFHEKRKRIFQAPEKVAGGRHSFECDIYSLGVVMAEMHLRKSFLHCNDPEVENGAEIFLLLTSQDESLLSACIKECMATSASDRPPIQEVRDRLERMDA